MLLVSCNKTFDKPQEMAEFIADPDNGYCYTKKAGGVDYTLQYRPTDLLVEQEIGQNPKPGTIEQTRKKYEKYLYFNLSMAMNKKELLNNLAADKERFGQMLSELSFGMDQKIHLYTATKDTIAMSDFSYPRMFGISDATTILVAYPRDEKYMNEKYMDFTIEDLGLYTGEIKFRIDMSKLRTEPQLRFK